MREHQHRLLEKLLAQDEIELCMIILNEILNSFRLECMFGTRQSHRPIREEHVHLIVKLHFKNARLTN